MKQILMIGTGGTIASEMTEAGLVPGMSGAEFLQYIPSVEKLCQVDCLQVCNIDWARTGSSFSRTGTPFIYFLPAPPPTRLLNTS